MSWTLCTSGAAIAKAGEYVDSTISTSGALMTDLSDEVESYICALVRSDVVGNFGSLTANGKQILAALAASKIGQELICYNASGYTSRFEAQLMLDRLENDIRKMEAIVKENQNKAYLGIT